METKTKLALWLLGFILAGLLLGTEAWMPNETVWKNRGTTHTVNINQ